MTAYVERIVPFTAGDGMALNLIHVRGPRPGAFADVGIPVGGHDDSHRDSSGGINSIQLFNDGKRWWVMNIMWDAERPGLTIPGQYLGQ